MKAKRLLQVVFAIILALTLFNGIAVLSSPAQAAAAGFDGDLFSNGEGKFACICGGDECQPCGNIEPN